MSRCARLQLTASVLCALTACQDASFESLGVVPVGASAPAPSQDAGAPDAARPRVDVDAAPPRSAEVDAAAASNQGSTAPAAAFGSAGMPAPSVSAGAAAPPAALSGKIGTTNFTALTGYVSGLSEEYATTTLYLFDSNVSCAQLSTFAWLSQLPSTINVIEVTFPATASVGTPVTDATVSYAHGGMYAFAKMRASMVTLQLAHAAQARDVEGTLSATFGASSIQGAFSAKYCATGTAL